ncbi:MAG: hypothetical protein AAF598_04990, partial [Bacteroidota bacterium]
QNSKDTIDFDEPGDEKIREMREQIGVDGALLTDPNGEIYRVNFLEKILATLLSKLSNFIPEGGIWMNTQRPEWNDANNALVGNGVSMVTLYYLRRFLTFFQEQFATTNKEKVELSTELIAFFDRVHQTFAAHTDLLSGKINDTDRKTVMDGLGQAGSDYREQIYAQGFSGQKGYIEMDALRQFVDLSLQHLDHTITANKRSDAMYHAYNLMTVENDQEVSISYLSEMLEGQVAALSAGSLPSEEALSVLDGLKASALFREDQYSYILYPFKKLPRFQAKNTLPGDAVASSPLLTKLVKDGNLQVIEKDVNGAYHFNGNFHNAKDVVAALDSLDEGSYKDLVASDREAVLQLFEDVFNHKAFTGRSGTFYGYEGLGSIYWHMVSKLQLAVMECCIRAVEEQASAEVVGRLLEHYYEINEGIGVHKPPQLYGAFPTDPYSHTPGGKGAQQPGMTGQVKEDILSRFGELGVFVKAGQLSFNPCLLRKDEFLDKAGSFEYVDVAWNKQSLEIEAGSLVFTYCQIPVVYRLADKHALSVTFQDGNTQEFEALSLDRGISQKIFGRTGEVAHVSVHLLENDLR